MDRLKAIAFVIALVVNLPPQVGALSQSQKSSTSVGTAAISGIVISKGSGVRNVTVALTPMGSSGTCNQNCMQRTKTDVGGRFQFTGLLAGQYLVRALAPGYVSPSNTSFGPGGKQIHLSEGESAENIELELKLGGVITGRVADSRGNPIAEEVIGLMKLDERGKPQQFYQPGGTFSFITDDRGIYRIFSLPAGRYLVSAGIDQREGAIMMTAQRTLYPRTFHPDKTDESQATIIEIGEGAEVPGVDISIERMRKTYDILGRVFDGGSGQGVAGLEINYGTLSKSNSLSSSGSSFQRSNERGEFVIQGVLPGKYAVFARLGLDSDYYSETVMIEIGEEDVSGVDVKLQRGASINGVAVLEGVSDLAVRAKLWQFHLWFLPSDRSNALRNDFTKIQPDGSFRVKGLKPGFYTLLAPEGATYGFSILLVEKNGVQIPPNKAIEIAIDDQPADVRVTFGYGTAAIRGQAKIVNGQLPPGIELLVSAQRSDDGRYVGRSSSVDARGQFLIECLMPGDYELRLNVYNRIFGEEIPPLIRAKAEAVKQKIAVGSSDARVTVILDLGAKEGSQ